MGFDVKTAPKTAKGACLCECTLNYISKQRNKDSCSGTNIGKGRSGSIGLKTQGRWETVKILIVKEEPPTLLA